MLPSFTVPKRVRAPRNELRVDQLVVDTPVSKFIDCSICQMNLRPDGAMSRSPRKPMYEFCTSTALRAPGDTAAQPPVFVAPAPVVEVPQMPVVDTSVETVAPFVPVAFVEGWLGSLLVP